MHVFIYLFIRLFMSFDAFDADNSTSEVESVCAWVCLHLSRLIVIL